MKGIVLNIIGKQFIILVSIFVILSSFVYADLVINNISVTDAEWSSAVAEGNFFGVEFTMNETTTIQEVHIANVSGATQCILLNGTIEDHNPIDYSLWVANVTEGNKTCPFSSQALIDGNTYVMVFYNRTSSGTISYYDALPVNASHLNFSRGYNGGGAEQLRVYHIQSIVTGESAPPPTVAGTNLTMALLSPSNGTVNNTATINFDYNVTSNSSDIDECRLYMNSTGGTWGINLTNTTPTNNSANKFIVNNLVTGESYLWNVECCAVDGNCSFTSGGTVPENRTLTIDTIDPTITADNIRLNKTFTYDILGGQINVSDDNLFNINVSINGSQVFNISNMVLTSYQYNFSFNRSNLTAGVYNFTFRACDGHTNFKLEDKWEYDIGLSGLKFEEDKKWYRINPENSDLFESISTNRLLDRYDFKYKKSWMGDLLGKADEYVFVVESNEPIYITTHPNFNYNGWLVIPTIGKNGRWIDFNLKDIPEAKYTIRRISENEVEITITNIPKEIDELIFKSTGELNCAEEMYFWYKYDYNYTSESPVLENQLVNFTLNITINNSFIDDVNATLYYNNSKHTSTKTNYSTENHFYFNVELNTANVTTTENVTWYWNFTLQGSITQQNVTPTEKQLVGETSIDNCTTNTALALNFTIRNETNDVLITSDLDVIFLYTVEGVEKNYSVGLDTRNNFDFCIYPSWSNFTSDITLQYSATDYDTRDWIKKDYRLDNFTNNVTLYLLTSAESTEVNVEVVDENDDDLEDVLIEVYKYAIDTNEYKLVSSETTDSEGQAQFQLVVGSTYYQFQFYVNGELELTSSTFKITDTDLRYVITDVVGSPILDLLRAKNISGTISYTNNSQTFVFTWNDSSSYSSEIQFEIKRDINTTIYINTSTAGSGTMSFPLTEGNRSYTAVGSAKVGGRFYILDIKSVNLRDYWRIFGFTQSLIMSMLIILLLGLIGVKSPQLCIVTTSIGLIVVFFMGMMPIAFKALISICAVGVILLSLMKERYYP